MCLTGPVLLTLLQTEKEGRVAGWHTYSTDTQGLARKGQGEGRVWRVSDG